MGWLKFIPPLAYWSSINNHEGKYTKTDMRFKHSRPNTRIFRYLLGRISHHFFFSNLHDIPFQHILWFIVPLPFLSLVQSELFSRLIIKRKKKQNLDIGMANHDVILTTIFSQSLSLWVGGEQRYRLSYHSSIQMDTIVISIHLSSITTFNFWVKQDFWYFSLNIPESR